MGILAVTQSNTQGLQLRTWEKFELNTLAPWRFTHWIQQEC